MEQQCDSGAVPFLPTGIEVAHPSGLLPLKRGAQIQVCPHSASCMLISWYPFLEGKCGVELTLVALPLMTAGWAEQGASEGYCLLFFFFSILAFNQSLLLITEIFPIGRNPTSSNTNFCLFMHMYKYINKSINPVSSELKKKNQNTLRRNVVGVVLLLMWKPLDAAAFSKCQARSWMSLFHPWCCRFIVTSQGSGACAGANLPVVSSLALFIHVPLASPVQPQDTEPGLGLQSCWSLPWRCFCCGYTCVISFCDYKCVCCWDLFCPALEFLHFHVHLTGNFARCLNSQKQSRCSYLEKFYVWAVLSVYFPKLCWEWSDEN